MQTKVTVTWLTPFEKMSNSSFVAERLAKLNSMSISKTLIDNPKNECYASITFEDEILANDWVLFITDLAAKYDKEIVSITVE